MSPTPRQLLGVWVIGSVLTGTLAVLLTIHRGPRRLQPLADLSTLSLAGVIGVLVALVAALGLLAWGTPGTTWLPDTARGRALWVVLVAAAGLAGWSYAAAATFVVDLPLDVQLMLAFTVGGLPFTVVATVLLRPVAASGAGLVLAVALLVTGFAVAPETLREGVRLLVVLTAP